MLLLWDEDNDGGTWRGRVLLRLAAVVLFVLGVACSLSAFYVGDWKSARPELQIDNGLILEEIHVGATNTCLRRRSFTNTGGSNSTGSDNGTWTTQRVCVEFTYEDADNNGTIPGAKTQDIRTGVWGPSQTVCTSNDRGDLALSLGIPPASLNVVAIWDTLCGSLSWAVVLLSWGSACLGLFAGFFRCLVCVPWAAFVVLGLGLLATVISLTTLLVWTTAVHGSGFHSGTSWWLQLTSTIAFGLATLTIPVEWICVASIDRRMMLHWQYRPPPSDRPAVH